jgi:uncharacterized protein
MKKVSTPCVNICVLEYGVCKGCKRTNKQIRDWLKYTEEQRQQIIKELEK